MLRQLTPKIAHSMLRVYASLVSFWPGWDKTRLEEVCQNRDKTTCPRSHCSGNFGFIVYWRINKLLLPHKLYSGAKHITLSSQRFFHFHCSIGTLFHSDKTNTIIQLSLYNRCLVKVICVTTALSKKIRRQKCISKYTFW